MADWLKLEGKVVAVTGGASGIGKHIASTLVAAGANTVVIDMNTKT
ncbi:MAG: SDR family NAD(P)-dependent oxidoreductase, partial [bacterium]